MNKTNLLTKLLLLCLCVVGSATSVWADDYADTYTNPASGSGLAGNANGMGAFSKIGSFTGNVSLGNSSLQIGTAGGSGTFAISSIDGSNITSITFTQNASYPINTLTSSDGTITQDGNVFTFTPASAKTTAAFSMSAQSKGKVRLAPIVVNLTSDYEYFSMNFSVSSGTVSCTKSNASSDITMTTTGSASGNRLSLGNNKTLTITSSGHNIKAVHFTFTSHASVTLAASTGSYESNTWTAGDDTQTVTFTSSASNVIGALSVELEDIASGDAITLDKTLGTKDGSGTIAANATSFTPTAPTYTDHTVDGYYTTSECATLIATAAGALQPDVTVSETAWTNGSSQWVKGGDATFYTKWKVNAPTVSCEDNKVTITVPTGSTVYYTTDGETEPTSSSTPYSVPFDIAATTTVKAIAIQDYCTNSSVTTQECAYSAPKTATTTTISGTLDGDIKNGKNAGTLTAAVTYGDPATEILEPTIVWSSTDESVATVSAGEVTLVGEGSTTIKARYEGDATYEASEDTYDLVVTDTRESVTLAFSAKSITDYNYDGEPLTAPTLTATNGSEEAIDLANLPELSFAESHASGSATVTVNATTGALTAENTFGTSTITASFPGNENYKPATSKTYTVSRSPMLYQVKFSNGFEAFINEIDKTVSVYYMAGTSAPSQTGTIQKATGYAAEVVSNTVVLTKDDKTKTYDIVSTAVTPFEGSGKQTFSAVPDYVASVYGFDATKKLKYSKKGNLDESKTDWTREAKGNSRLYFFVGAATNMLLTEANVAERNIKVYVNGVLDETITKIEKNGTITIGLNDNTPNMVEIQSNQTSGDGGFKDITLTDPIKPVKIASSGWTSLASAYDLNYAGAAEQEGVALKAYAISSISKTSVTLTAHDAAPAGEGMILKGKAGSTYYIPITADVAAFDDNDNELDAAVTATEVAANSVYAVSEGKLKLFTGTTVPAGKAYLDATKVPKEARGLSLNFDEDGETTGIAEINSKKGLLDGDFYDLSGRKVAQPTKGLYIMNGRKVIVK